MGLIQLKKGERFSLIDLIENHIEMLKTSETDEEAEIYVLVISKCIAEFNLDGNNLLARKYIEVYSNVLEERRIHSLRDYKKDDKYVKDRIVLTADNLYHIEDFFNKRSKKVS